ncbi:hypothetical protein V6N13_094918 [Hibiscus sabdariffa]
MGEGSDLKTVVDVEYVSQISHVQFVFTPRRCNESPILWRKLVCKEFRCTNLGRVGSSRVGSYAWRSVILVVLYLELSCLDFLFILAALLLNLALFSTISSAIIAVLL